MIKNILIDDWRANCIQKRFVKLNNCDKRLVDAVRKLEENLPKNLKLKITGRYECSLGNNYSISLKLSEKKLFSKPISQYDFFLDKNLDFYWDNATSEEIYNVISKSLIKNN